MRARCLRCSIRLTQGMDVVSVCSRPGPGERAEGIVYMAQRIPFGETPTQGRDGEAQSWIFGAEVDHGTASCAGHSGRVVPCSLTPPLPASLERFRGHR